MEAWRYAGQGRFVEMLAEQGRLPPERPFEETWPLPRAPIDEDSSA